MRNYERLNLEAFGAELLRTNDLDPVYVALHGTPMPQRQLKRWLLAYWCCYNAGESCWLSESKGDWFWGHLMTFAENTSDAPIGGRWPRGRERRHYRGKAAIKSVAYLRTVFQEPEDAVDSIAKVGDSLPYQVIRDRVCNWPLFGPWIAFKVGDMMERVVGVHVDFTDSDVFFFDSPRVAAEEWFGESKPEAIPAACAHLQKHLGHRTAPPLNDRPVNVQEFETVLCKWHSHMTGYYPVGNDTMELKEALHPWAKVSATAERMIACL